MDSELEDFKSRIDLREYAASLGYELVSVRTLFANLGCSAQIEC